MATPLFERLHLVGDGVDGVFEELFTICWGDTADSGAEKFHQIPHQVNEVGLNNVLLDGNFGELGGKLRGDQLWPRLDEVLDEVTQTEAR